MIRVELLDSKKLTEEQKSLYITFDYDYRIVELIKTIKPRQYHYENKSWELSQKSIHRLIELFGKENLLISDNVNLEYKEEYKEIDLNGKWSCFAPLFNKMTSATKRFTIEILKQVPSYFYEVAASSTGKYHPGYALGKEGLLRHTLGAGAIAVELFNNDTVCGQFTNREKELMLAAIILHDTFKHGEIENRYTVAEHPIIASNFIRNFKQNIIPKEDQELIADCIATHMGQWNTDFRTKAEIMEKPSNEMQSFVHLCDYLSSRKIIEINFDEII